MQTATETTLGIVDALTKGTAPVSEIRVLFRHPAAVVRANALNALIPHAKIDGGLIEFFVAAAQNPINEVRLMGTISVAHVAVGCLNQIGTQPALVAATELLVTWPEPDRTDLRWYLHSEGHAPA